MIYPTFLDAISQQELLNQGRRGTFTVEMASKGKFSVIAYNYAWDLFLDIITFSVHYFVKQNEAVKLLRELNINDLKNHPKSEWNRISNGLHRFIQMRGCDPKEARHYLNLLKLAPADQDRIEPEELSTDLDSTWSDMEDDEATEISDKDLQS